MEKSVLEGTTKEGGRRGEQNEGLAIKQPQRKARKDGEYLKQNRRQQ
jgi:hypothetical protein